MIKTYFTLAGMEISSKVLFAELVRRLTLPVSQEEKEAIIYWLLESTLELSRPEILIDKKVPNPGSTFKEILTRLNHEEPIQYILNESFFYGRRFFVNPSVLIPRPETEVLVETIIHRSASPNPRILDIATGSGCMGVTLALEMPEATVTATDISLPALQVAKKNAELLGANVTFISHNILGEELSLPSMDIIISNPPYIPLREKSGMARNVKDFEPSIALFVDNSNPLIFYEAITTKSFQLLSPTGILMTEIHENFGDAVRDLFEKNGFSSVSITKDLTGKDRFVSGVKI